MNITPRISVLVPMYNAGPLIAQALNSILAQTLPVAEIIVVNDGSTDESPQLAASYPNVTLLHQENQGCAMALNTGLSAATGDYFAFLDADDRWLPEKIERQVSALVNARDMDMVFSHCRRFISKGQGTGYREQNLDEMVGIHKNCMLIRRESFLKTGGFSRTNENHDFLDWFARAQEAGLRHDVLPQVLAERRIHENNQGIVNREQQRHAYFKTLKTMLDRRRSGET